MTAQDPPRGRMPDTNLSVPALHELLQMDPHKAMDKIAHMDRSRFQKITSSVLSALETQRKENALLYYKPVSTEAMKVHESKATKIGLFGGNRSSKTETALAEMSVCATGIIPNSLKHLDWSHKIRGPGQYRVVCESLTTVLHPIMLPKLKYWSWIGHDSPGGNKGHWGWIPRDSLIGGSWDKSWSEKLRTLKLIYRDPKTGLPGGESTIQFLSIDQDPSDFASGEFQLILQDEPPPLAIWRENEARIMSVGGRMILSMTWPDDPAIAVDWIHDEVYEPGQEGPGKNPNIDCYTLYTTDNPYLDQNAISAQSSAWSEEIREVRIRGGHLRFSNRIHPLFTKTDRTWCFGCGKTTVSVDHGACSRCNSGNIVNFNHVKDFDTPRWPVVFLIDPHPRKPHMMMWVAIDPQDDLWQIDELLIDGDPAEVAKEVRKIEKKHNLMIAQRMIDPNMGRSVAGTRRNVTWQDEFDSVGLNCDLSDDADPGRGRINEYLKPDPRTIKPKICVHSRCVETAKQMLRYRWDEHAKRLEKDLKQKPKTKDDDFPTLWKYLLNSDPSFAFHRMGPQIIRRRK